MVPNMNSQTRNSTKPVEEAGGTLLGTSWNALLPGNSPDLEDRGILPANQGRGFRPGTCTRENATAFTDDMYEGPQRNEQAVAAAIDLEDAYNRVQFKLLMDMLMQYGVCLTLIRWIAGALLERTVVMQLGNCSSSAHNEPTTRITTLGDPLQYLRQRPSRS